MTTATYYSAPLLADGDATGVLTIDNTALLVVGARVVLIDKDSEPVQYKIKEILSETQFSVCNVDDTDADLTAYTVARASRVTQYYQDEGDCPQYCLPDPTDKANQALFSDGTQYVLRYIKESDIQKVFAITGFSVSSGTLEVGATLTNPTFTASYNRTPTQATLTDNQGTPAKDVTSTPTAFGLTATYKKTGNNESVSFTLSAAEGAETSTKGASVSWRPRAYYGAGDAGINTEAGIKALSSSTLAGSRSGSITVTAGAGKYIYYAFPTSYGAPSFAVGGFEGGFELAAASVSVTNAFGVTQTYQVWKSAQPNLGTTTVAVS